MVARLDGLKSFPRVPEDIMLRNLNRNEEKELVEAVNAGFGWERLKMGIVHTWETENPPFSEERVRVADFNNKIVSVVVSKPDTRHNESFNGKRGYLGPATTLAEFRGKNLASALTARAINLLFENGMDSVALYTVEQNVPSVILLQKLGFEIGHHWRFMRKNLQPKKSVKNCRRLRNYQMLGGCWKRADYWRIFLQATSFCTSSSLTLVSMNSATLS
jgi:ribosomal protein S18 acetylase RimI-like enzyme